MKFYNIIKRILSIGLCLIMLITLFSACGSSTKINKITISDLKEQDCSYTEAKNHIIDSKKLIFVARSGLIELYFDNNTYSIAVKETGTGKIWYSLPQMEKDQTEEKAAVLNLKVSKGDTIYKINSQDNSVAFSSASFKPISGGIQITYNMALTKEVANSSTELLAGNELYVSMTVTFSLADGAFHAKIDCGDMSISEGYQVEDIELLSHFGANIKSEPSDYILLPDGSGATLMTGVKAEDAYELRHFDVYGKDFATYSQAEDKKEDVKDITSAKAMIPAFGFKSGESAFLALIQSGDAISTISSQRFNGSGTSNRVFSSFKITNISYSDTVGKRTKYIGDKFNGEIDVCYRFLSNKNASYSGMAAACREMLIRASVLSTKTLTNSEYLPLLLETQGLVSKNGKNSYKKLSTFEDTQELLTLMKAKSINNIYLKYDDVLDGGDSQSILSKAKISTKLGNKKSFESLKQYVSTQKFTMFVGTDLNSFNKNGASVSKNSAKNIAGKNLSYEKKNPLSEFAGKQTNTRYASALSDMEKNVSSFITNNKDYTFDGYAINDAGNYLYSDYSNDFHSRVNAQNILKSQTEMLSTGHKVMIDGGNFYILKNADVIANIPSSTVYPETEGYLSVPFVQLVLHGIVDYSLTPINEAENPDKAFLKSVEYGAIPSYKFYYEKTEIPAIDAKYNYENNVAKAAENYAISNSTIGNLRNARMTSHYKIQDGVFVSEYNNSIIIYFNYNDKPITINSITIEPMSCLRIN
ncbi:MAG: DUF5696 domain-containing protein [Oscillospiraceae bacterium]